MSDDEQPAPTPRLREATSDEDKLLHYLSRMVGQALLTHWDRLPVEFRASHSMVRAFCSALAHNLGHLVGAAAPMDTPVDDPRWVEFLDTTLAMVRANAVDARRKLLTPAEGAEGTEAERPAAVVPRVYVQTPKYLM